MSEEKLNSVIVCQTQAKEKISPFTQKYIVGAVFGEEKITAYFNNQPYHGPPLALSMVHNAILKSYKGEDYGIHIVNHPLPYQGVDKVKIKRKIMITYITELRGAFYTVLIYYISLTR